MKLALIGYGAMGRLVSTRAAELGYELGTVLTSADAGRSVDELAEQLRGHDMAIDFSVADAVVTSVAACGRAQVPIIEGTTGWGPKMAEVRRTVWKSRGAMVFGSNFSIGMNLFYRIITRAAEVFANISEYDPFIAEAHHARKRDDPSGTALRIRELMAEHVKREIPIFSTRAGHIPGTHQVGFDSTYDQILLTHTARSRDGFAAGALASAKWLIGKQGVYEFAEILDQIIQPPSEGQA
ncbi:MAG: dihydrodipicolinate reductase [Acidobacteria bacterium]|nr:dihydrodipicolinate reductase [Acidobacteriota bacterium]